MRKLSHKRTGYGSTSIYHSLDRARNHATILLRTHQLPWHMGPERERHASRKRARTARHGTQHVSIASAQDLSDALAATHGVPQCTAGPHAHAQDNVPHESAHTVELHPYMWEVNGIPPCDAPHRVGHRNRLLSPSVSHHVQRRSPPREASSLGALHQSFSSLSMVETNVAASSSCATW